VPTAADSVIFDQATTYTVTCTGALTCLDITVSAGTVTFADGTTPTFAITGSMSLVAATVWSATGTITFNATATGKTVTTNGVSLSGAVVFSGVGGGWTLGSAFTTISSVTVTRGTFSTGNFACSNDSWSISGTLTRSVSLGTSTITLSQASGLGAWLASLTTNLTLTAGTSTINCTGSNASFAGGGLTYSTVGLTSTTNGAFFLITGVNTFLNLNISAPTVGVKTVSILQNNTITGTLTANGGSYNARTFIYTDASGTVSTITAAAVALAYCDFQDITAAGASGTWSGTSFGNCGGNSNITFTTVKTVYWNLAGAQNWSATGWATSSGGTPAAANFPLAQDTAVFDNTGSVTGTITVNSAWNIGTLDMSTRTSAMTLATSTNLPLIYGSWKNGSGTTLTGTGELVFSGRSATQQITSSGKTFTQKININAVSNTVQLIDALTSSISVGLILNSGTININGQTLTVVKFNAATFITRNLTFNGGTLAITGTGVAFTGDTSANGFTTTAGTGTGAITLTSASAKTFSGGGNTYNCTINQGGAGALTITGANTFADITNTYNATGATSILFTAGTTSTFTNWSASGAVGNILTIASVTAATHTLSKATGTVNASYLSLTNSIATGGATWNATNSVNGGGNTGWVITGAAPSSTGNFFFMFN
jgi:hypothetical protein